MLNKAPAQQILTELGITADDSAKIEKKVTLELYQAQCKLVQAAGITNILMGLFIVFVFYSQFYL